MTFPIYHSSTCKVLQALVIFSFPIIFQRALEPPDVHHDRLLSVSVLGFLVNLVGIFVFKHGGHGHSHDGGKRTTINIITIQAVRENKTNIIGNLYKVKLLSTLNCFYCYIVITVLSWLLRYSKLFCVLSSQIKMNRISKLLAMPA